MAGSQGRQIQRAVGAVLKTGAQAGAGTGQSSLPLGRAWGCLASALWPHLLFMSSHPYLSPVPETIRTARPHSHCIGKETRGSDGVCGLLQVTPPTPGWQGSVSPCLRHLLTLEDAEKVQDRRTALERQVLLPLLYTPDFFSTTFCFFWVNGFILQLLGNLRNSY